MAHDGFVRLEQQVEALIQALGDLRGENELLRERLEKREESPDARARDRQNLDSTSGSLAGDSGERERKLHTAAEKLEGLIARLESAR